MAHQLDRVALERRRDRLVAAMHRERWDLVVLSRRESVLWLTGARAPWPLSPLASLDSQGEIRLIWPQKPPEEAAAHVIDTYPAKWLSTMRSDQAAAAADVFLASCSAAQKARRVAVEFSDCPLHLSRRLPGVVCDVEPILFDLRRYKEADELEAIRMAIAGTERMYQRAREIIAPGLSEIDMFNALQTAAVEHFDEPLTGTGNDYRCGSRGGGPRGGRVAQRGELWILDLGPAYRGYYADNARTLAVSDPTEDQLEAHRRIVEVFDHVVASVRPGKSCRQLFDEVAALLASAPFGKFDHHLGHGIGLHPHEAPHLNPHWDDAFREGDVFTVEPGLYDETRLRHGIRLENDYRVTTDGVELLTPFSLELR